MSNGKWQVDYYADGVRIREVVGSKAAAQRKLNLRRGEVERGAHGDPRVTFGRWIESPKWKNRPTPESQRVWDESAIRNYFEGLAHVPLVKITEGDLESLQAKLKAMPGRVGDRLSPATVNAAMKTLKLVLQSAKKHRVLAAVPDFPRRLQKDENPDPLTAKERAALLAVFNNRAAFVKSLGSEAQGERAEPAWQGFQRFKAAVVLALETGISKSDLLDLRWRAVTKATIEGKRNKTGEPYTVPLTAAAREALRACRRDVTPDAHVLVNMEGKPFQPSRINRLFKKAKTLAKITRRFRFHDIRHSYGHRLKSSGKVSDAGIRLAMGWAEGSGMVFHYGGTPDPAQIHRDILEALQ